MDELDSLPDTATQLTLKVYPVRYSNWLRRDHTSSSCVYKHNCGHRALFKAVSTSGKQLRHRKCNKANKSLDECKRFWDEFLICRPTVYHRFTPTSTFYLLQHPFPGNIKLSTVWRGRRLWAVQVTQVICCWPFENTKRHLQKYTKSLPDDLRCTHSLSSFKKQNGNQFYRGCCQSTANWLSLN